eukprot:Ihof_evm17s20 gene=Ihof_evmTU17s20
MSDIPSTPYGASSPGRRVPTSDMDPNTPSMMSNSSQNRTPAYTPRGLRSSQGYSDASRGTPRDTPRPRANLNPTNAHRFVSTPRREAQGEPHAEGQQPMEEGQEAAQRTFIWGTNVDIHVLERGISTFFQEYKENEDDVMPLYRKLMETTKLEGLDFINLDCSHLYTFDRTIYSKVVQFPSEVIPIIDICAAGLYEEWCDGEPNFLTTRPFNLQDETTMRNLNPDDVDKLVAIRGMVIRCTPVVPDMHMAFFRCIMCKFTTETALNSGRIAEPESCTNCNSKNTMEIIHNRSSFLDKQVVKLQESPEIIPAGQTPQTVLLLCYDEFVDIVQPGDRVEVTGIFRANTLRPNKNQRTIRAIFKTHLDVVHFKKTDRSKLRRTDIAQADQNTARLVDDQPDAERDEATNQRMRELAQSPDIYKMLTGALAPSIWGQEDIKKGILCQLFGGTNKNFEEFGFGRFRGDINILLCGDPSTSKSQFLSMVHKISSRGIYTSGKGSSSVGLTAYVTKDPDTNELVLESGALVLSDGGICCIDEFDKMSESTRSVLHEAMEQQTVSIAKAGIICTLNARTSILAAANPVNSAWDTKMSIIDNLQMPPTLISRFDLIYLVVDRVDEEMDRRLASHIVSLYDKNHDFEAQYHGMNLQTLMEYISYARQHIHPVLSDAAAAELVEGYTDMRRVGQRSKTITATPRQLESLIRLSEALARMRYSQTVDRVDVVEAMRLVNAALLKVAMDPKTGMLNMDLIHTGLTAQQKNEHAAVTDIIENYTAAGQGRAKKSLSLGDLLRMVHEAGRQ